MKRLMKISIAIVSFALVIDCSKEEAIEATVAKAPSQKVEKVSKKAYSYNVNQIYTKASAGNYSRTNGVSHTTYVIPTVYKGKNYDFEITTLNSNGQEFNVTFTDNGTTYSNDFRVHNNKLYALKKGLPQVKDSFTSCILNHDGSALAFLTGACAGIASFIPFLQPVAFACAAETAVIAAGVAADCASN